MATAADQLISFVRDCLARGDITRGLTAAGWSEREATLALDAFADSSLPLLWLAQRTIDRDTAGNPESRLTPVYRFLADLAVLVMALVMLGDLVYVVFNLLQGDATPRFLLKSLVVLAVAGVVSLWYAGDLRREESPAGPTGPRTYELTATFDLESPPRDSSNETAGSRDGCFTHGPGQRTFTVTVPEKPKP